MSAIQPPPPPQRTGNPQIDSYLDSLYQWAYVFWFNQTGAGVGVIQVPAGGTGADNAVDARDNLGLEIGSDVQAYSANLTEAGTFFGSTDITGAEAETLTDGSNADGLHTHDHDQMTGLQGGTTSEYYHLTSAQHTDLTDGNSSSLHYHDSDRDRANHTGQQSISTLSDLPTLTQGTYTPTLTNTANLDGSTAYECQYMRVGNMVTVSGKISADPTLAATSTQLGISLPIASDFGTEQDCGGVAFATGIAGQGAGIKADTTNDRALMQWVSGDVTNQPMFFIFGYQII